MKKRATLHYGRLCKSFGGWKVLFYFWGKEVVSPRQMFLFSLLGKVGELAVGIGDRWQVSSERFFFSQLFWYFGVGAIIRTGREIQSLRYAGLLFINVCAFMFFRSLKEWYTFLNSWHIKAFIKIWWFDNKIIIIEIIDSIFIKTNKMVGLSPF